MKYTNSMKMEKIQKLHTIRITLPYDSTNFTVEGKEWRFKMHHKVLSATRFTYVRNGRTSIKKQKPRFNTLSV